MFPHIPEPRSVTFCQVLAFYDEENGFLAELFDFQTGIGNEVISENLNQGISGIFFRQEFVLEFARKPFWKIRVLGLDFIIEKLEKLYFFAVCFLKKSIAICLEFRLEPAAFGTYGITIGPNPDYVPPDIFLPLKSPVNICLLRR